VSQMIPEEGRYVTDQGYPVDVNVVLSEAEYDALDERGVEIVTSGEGGSNVPADLPIPGRQ
jgi:hypothetical protein